MERRSLVKVRFDLGGERVAGETVWAEALGDGLYRLRNAPFYAAGYAEGDVVRCEVRGGWREVTETARESGNGTLRLLFADAGAEAQRRVLNELASVGCTYERASARLVAVTVPPTAEVPFSQMSNYLNAVPDEVLAGWEIGKRPTR